MAGVYSVSQITAYIKHMFEQDFALNRVSVKGEVSNCKYHSSGHLYFTLKDASGAIACIMFAGSRKAGDVRLRDGMQIIAKGSVRVYERDGNYHLYVTELTDDGVGQLYRMFEERKRELEEMGMFDVRYKKPIPRYAKTIGIVTSATGAAIRDIMNVSARRNPYVQLILCPAQVQGPGAAAEIVRAIETLDELHPDCMIIGRGGGSIEDLWAFNEEAVAYAIFQCDTPVISAVGHETDFTIADFAADLRAPTPSAAAELAVFDFAQFYGGLEQVRDRLIRLEEAKLQDARARADKSLLRLKLLHPGVQLEKKRETVSQVRAALVGKMEQEIQKYRYQLGLKAQRLQALSPLSRLESGYALVTDFAGKPVLSAGQLSARETIRLYMKDGIVQASVQETAPADWHVRKKENADRGNQNGEKAAKGTKG